MIRDEFKTIYADEIAEVIQFSDVNSSVIGKILNEVCKLPEVFPGIHEYKDLDFLFSVFSSTVDQWSMVNANENFFSDDYDHVNISEVVLYQAQKTLNNGEPIYFPSGEKSR